MIWSKMNLLAIGVLFLFFVNISIYYKEQLNLGIRLFERNRNESYFKIDPGSNYEKSCLDLNNKLRFPKKN